VKTTLLAEGEIQVLEALRLLFKQQSFTQAAHPYNRRSGF
jgi:hypothetical protein